MGNRVVTLAWLRSIGKASQERDGRGGERGAVGAARAAGGSASSPRGLTPSTRTRSSRWSAATSAARAGCSTSGAGRARSPGASRASARRWWASTPPPVRSRTARDARRRPPLPPCTRRGAAVCEPGVRHGRALPRAGARRRLRDGHPRGGPGPRTRWTVRAGAVPPAAPGPRRRLDRRPDRRRAVLADRRLPPTRSECSTRSLQGSTCCSSTAR